MKKGLVVVAALMLSSVSTFAQHAVGSFNLQPKVGVSIANLTKDKGQSESNDARVGLVAGVEGEYQVSDIFSVTGGLLYSMQGCKNEVSALGSSKKATTKLDYLNVPILANIYVVKGLAVKLGVQPGFKLSAKNKAEITAPIVGTTSVTTDIKDVKSVDFSIPVGISYEYNNIQLDARYNWGLTKVLDNSDAKNSVFQITLGYKFDL